jgi:cytochrome c oxidase assembly protein Cox11
LVKVTCFIFGFALAQLYSIICIERGREGRERACEKERERKKREVNNGVFD